MTEKLGTATILQSDDEWVLCEFLGRRAFIEAIQASIPNSSYFIHYGPRTTIGVRTQYVSALRIIAGDFFERVQVSDNIRTSGRQDQEWREKYKRHRNPHTWNLESGVLSREESARRILYVTEDAPPEVIQAAYRALAKTHHSDAGGEDERMAEINEAMSTLRSEGAV